MLKIVKHIAYGVAALFALSACQSDDGCTRAEMEAFIGMSQSSPTQLGFGASLGVPFADLAEGEVRGLVGYEYSMWDGGHDNVYSAGVEWRRPLSPEPLASWVGVNAIYHRWVCTSEPDAGCSDNPAANGFGVNAIYIKPLADGAVRVWTSAGPKWLTDFKSDGDVVAFESGFGWHAKVGIEVPLGRDNGN